MAQNVGLNSEIVLISYDFSFFNSWQSSFKMLKKNCINFFLKLSILISRSLLYKTFLDISWFHIFLKPNYLNYFIFFHIQINFQLNIEIQKISLRLLVAGGALGNWLTVTNHNKAQCTCMKSEKVFERRENWFSATNFEYLIGKKSHIWKHSEVVKSDVVHVLTGRCKWMTRHEKNDELIVVYLITSMALVLKSIASMD